MTAKPYALEAWNLQDLFPGLEGAPIEGALKALEGKVAAFEGYRDRLGERLETGTLVEMLDRYNAIVESMNRLGGYAALRFSEDTQDEGAQTFMARMQQLSAQIDNRTLFFKLWWKALADEDAARLLEGVGDYRYWLEALRLQRPYTLSEPEEKIINLKDVNGVRALVTLYTMITNRYSFRLTVDGEEKELTREQLGVFVRHPDPDVRAAAYQELFRVFGEDASILGQIYQAIARDWRSEGVELRGYASPIAVRNLSNDIPDEVVQALLDVCRENAPLFQRYFKLKARWLGVEKLRRYDVYAPVAVSEKTYDYPKAVEMVLEGFERFEPRIAELARRVFDEHHIDSEIRAGKRAGAFCMTINPDLTPWILHSYNGKPRDVVTLAHELGHAIHSLMAADHKALVQHATIPLAETASTFGQMLLVDHLLAEESDESVRRDLLFEQMDDAYATIMRQAYFAIFEQQAHEGVHAGLTVTQLSDRYMENLREQFGDALDLSEDFRVEWLAIPHIYRTPFYVYGYAFGQLLVLALYQQYLEEGESFKPRYLQILAAGGSKAPIAVLDEAGLNVRTRDFWQGGFDVLKKGLEDLEGIAISS